ncbi:hypothetical protein SLS53_003933 [Cytospora paraplurivora]|uniref:ubiquitinyl hydrolase 1 n=1 Tax=Cytospora paraplurivora TaxID=2898453 RepID=A0AAN9UBQ1_9PEZI
MEQSQGLEDELAAQEAAARTWQPELEGPRLGDKTPIGAIMEEYAKADPIYVAKTSALSETYSHYRPVKGDGNCGWRAIGFCYFELLIQQGNQEFVDGEILRLRQLNDYLVNEGGHDPSLVEDFLEETFELLKELSTSIHDPDTSLAVLTTKFNDDASMGILYHLRLLASAWLKGHSDQYGAWCGNDPEHYSQTVIEPPEHEIDELGISLLVEILLKPAGVILEIVYLDRSAGTKANVHRFPDDDSGNNLTMHLLYRPGHYDILYKAPPRPPHREIQVNRMAYEPTNFPSVPQFQDPFGVNPLAMLPGFGSTNTFKNSHFNPAHFNNPNFQPEEYRPGVDDPVERCDRSARKRSHAKVGHHSSDDNADSMESREK